MSEYENLRLEAERAWDNTRTFDLDKKGTFIAAYIAAKQQERKSPELMTRRQLAEWLARGNGEYTYSGMGTVFIHYSYIKGEADKPLDNTVQIRRFSEVDWIQPTMGVFLNDCRQIRNPQLFKNE